MTQKNSKNVTTEIKEAIAAQETVAQETVEPTIKVTKASIVRGMFNAGQSRAEIAKALNIRYQQVFAYTVNMTNEHHNAETTGRSIMVEKEDGSSVTRKAYVAEELKKGRTRGAIAKELGVPYQVIYGYCKSMGMLEYGGRVAEKTEETVAVETK